MSTRTKGIDTTKIIIRTLRREGYQVHDAERVGKNYRGPRDAFGGRIDLIAIHPAGGTVLLIQAKTNRPATHSIYEDMSEEWTADNVIIAQWVRRTKEREFVIHEYTDGLRKTYVAPMVRVNGLWAVDLGKEERHVLAGP